MWFTSSNQQPMSSVEREYERLRLREQERQRLRDLNQERHVKQENNLSREILDRERTLGMRNWEHRVRTGRRDHLLDDDDMAPPSMPPVRLEFPRGRGNQWFGGSDARRHSRSQQRDRSSQSRQGRSSRSGSNASNRQSSYSRRSSTGQDGASAHPRRKTDRQAPAWISVQIGHRHRPPTTQGSAPRTGWMNFSMPSNLVTTSYGNFKTYGLKSATRALPGM